MGSEWKEWFLKTDTIWIVAAFKEPAGATTLRATLSEPLGDGTETLVWSLNFDVTSPDIDTYSARLLQTPPQGVYKLRIIRGTTVLATGIFGVVDRPLPPAPAKNA